MGFEVLNQVEVFAAKDESFEKVLNLYEKRTALTEFGLAPAGQRHWGSSLNKSCIAFKDGSFRLDLLFFSRGEMPSELIELLEDLELDFSAQEFHPTDNVWHSDAEVRADMKAEEVK